MSPCLWSRCARDTIKLESHRANEHKCTFYLKLRRREGESSTRKSGHIPPSARMDLLPTAAMHTCTNTSATQLVCTQKDYVEVVYDPLHVHANSSHVHTGIHKCLYHCFVTKPSRLHAHRQACCYRPIMLLPMLCRKTNTFPCT